MGTSAEEAERYISVALEKEGLPPLKVLLKLLKERRLALGVRIYIPQFGPSKRTTVHRGHFSLDKWQAATYVLTERLVKRVKRHEPGREGTAEMGLSDSFSRFTLTQALIPPELA